MRWRSSGHVGQNALQLYGVTQSDGTDAAQVISDECTSAIMITQAIGAKMEALESHLGSMYR